jgi:hypothetical protein
MDRRTIRDWPAAPFDIRRPKWRRNSRIDYMKSDVQAFEDACDKLPFLPWGRQVAIFHV